MARLVLSISLLVCAFGMNASAGEQQASGHPIAIVMHGGAGTIRREQLTPELEKQYRAKLDEALHTGYAVLQKGGTSLDAVESAIRVLEDSPLFNAGKGAVFDHAGHNELDASIMDGKSLNAGAVAGVQHIANPISLARLVMDRSPHVLLAGEGAEQFARKQGIQMVPQSYFFTQERWDQLQKILHPVTDKGKQSLSRYDSDHLGTVGAVALDRYGNLAAGTSTGGLTNKQYGRIGDSPIIGAGTYANNATCGVSSTGWGEYFIRSVVAYDISALMQYKGLSVQQAAEEVVMHKVPELGGDGGVIAMDHDGNISMVFNTPGMYRGYIDTHGQSHIAIFRE